MSIENWKDVIGFEGRYMVSDKGRVKSIPRKGRISERILRPGNCRGYLSVVLSKGQSNFHSFTVHRLVAIAFISNPDNKPQINHIDGIKSNNIAENLEWVSCHENLIHSFKIGLADRKGEKHTLCKLTEKIVLEIRGKYTPNEYSYKRLSDEYKISKPSVKDIIKRRTWKHI